MGSDALCIDTITGNGGCKRGGKTDGLPSDAVYRVDIEGPPVEVR